MVYRSQQVGGFEDQRFECDNVGRELFVFFCVFFGNSSGAGDFPLRWVSKGPVGRNQAVQRLNVVKSWFLILGDEKSEPN